jgi:hypothetical protein
MPTQALLQPSARQASLQASRRDFRQHCSPQAERLPVWLRRVWAWF